jgi:hypothetical protein
MDRLEAIAVTRQILEHKALSNDVPAWDAGQAADLRRVAPRTKS